MKQKNEPQAVELAVPVVEPVPAAPVAEVAQEDDGGDVVQITPPTFTVPAKLQTRKYWIGVRTDAPFECVSAAGISFLKFKGPPPVDDSGTFDEKRIERCGDIVQLNDAQIEKLHERLACKTFVRRIGRSDSVSPAGVRRAPEYAEFQATDLRSFDPVTHASRVRPFTPTPDHEWTAFYLFMLPIDSAPVRKLREEFPESWFRRSESLPGIYSERYVIPRGTAQAA